MDTLLSLKCLALTYNSLNTHMIDKKPFEQKIQLLKQEGKYRVFNDILRERGKFPKAIWYGKYNIKEIVNCCSNDYRGMGQNKT